MNAFFSFDLCMIYLYTRMQATAKMYWNEMNTLLKALFFHYVNVVFIKLEILGFLHRSDRLIRGSRVNFRVYKAVKMPRMGAFVVCHLWSASLQTTDNRRRTFGQVASEVNIPRNRPIINRNFLWRQCLLTDRAEMSSLYKGLSIDASYQVSVHLAKRFQRRRYFGNWPTRNKNCLQ